MYIYMYIYNSIILFLFNCIYICIYIYYYLNVEMVAGAPTPATMFNMQKKEGENMTN